jgi:putative ABC transport system permease protein
MAIGATSSGILKLVIGHGLRLSVAGIAVGVALSLALTRAMSSMLVGVRATDPATYAAASVAFFAVVMLACWFPARRAAAMDPNIALREE